MKELFMSIDCEGKVSAKGFAGFNGEHLASSIVVSFNCDAPRADYYRMYFETSDGKNVFSEQLHLENGKIVYNIPFDVTTMGHTVYWQLCGFALENEEVALIYKSEIVPIIFGGSISDEGELATEELVSSLETKLDKVERFVSEFGISDCNVEYGDASTLPSVALERVGDYQYSFNFTMPTNARFSKVSYQISTDAWDENLTTDWVSIPDVTRNSFVFLKPKGVNVKLVNDSGCGINSQKGGALSFCCSKLPEDNIVLDLLVVNL